MGSCHCSFKSYFQALHLCDVYRGLRRERERVFFFFNNRQKVKPETVFAHIFSFEELKQISTFLIANLLRRFKDTQTPSVKCVRLFYCCSQDDSNRKQHTSETSEDRDRAQTKTLYIEEI